MDCVLGHNCVQDYTLPRTTWANEMIFWHEQCLRCRFDLDLLTCSPAHDYYPKGSPATENSIQNTAKRNVPSQSEHMTLKTYTNILYIYSIVWDIITHNCT